MSALCIDEGKVPVLNNLIAAMGAGFLVRLFKSNTVPARGDTLATYTLANYSGYADQAPVFGAAALDSNNNAKATAATLTFAHNGGGTANTIYGYLMTEAGTGKVLYAERFSAPITMASASDSIPVTPALYQGPINPPA